MLPESLHVINMAVARGAADLQPLEVDQSSHKISQNKRKSIMRKTWQVHEAKARFSEFLGASCREGPQIVTKRGVKTAVLLSIEEWRNLQKNVRPSLKAMLLAPEARTESLVPLRTRYKRRSAPNLE